MTLQAPLTDWPALVRALMNHRDIGGRRTSAETIATLVVCHRSRLQQLLTEGTEPRHSLGVALIALHERWIGAAPVVDHSARKLDNACDRNAPVP